MWFVYYTKQALRDRDDLIKSELGDKTRELVAVVKENPFKTPPRFEKLVGDLAGVYSRRINIQHRLVYQVLRNEDGRLAPDGKLYEGFIKILRMYEHY